jgi:ParB-like chromosome segregation protein Spo0J
MIRELPIDRIHGRADARAIDQATVGGLAESIGAVGLINPIRVRANGDQWEVIAGMHRLAACRQLGLVEITAHVVTADDLHAELAMIDENLCRAELSASDRAMQTARRKAIYLELHPETAEHVAGGKGNATADNLSAVPSFADATASVTGADARTVRRDAERGEKVIAEAMAMIKGTKLDTGAYLDKLKRLSPNDQVTAAKRALARIREQERERSKGGIHRRVASKVADEPLSDAEAMEKWLATGIAWWNRGSQEWRDEFQSRIDTPVFDRSAA